MFLIVLWQKYELHKASQTRLVYRINSLFWDSWWDLLMCFILYKNAQYLPVSLLPVLFKMRFWCCQALNPIMRAEQPSSTSPDVTVDGIRVWEIRDHQHQQEKYFIFKIWLIATCDSAINLRWSDSRSLRYNSLQAVLRSETNQYVKQITK